MKRTAPARRTFQVNLGCSYTIPQLLACYPEITDADLTVILALASGASHAADLGEIGPARITANR